MKVLAEGVACLAVFLIVSNYFFVEHCYTKEYASYDISTRFLYYNIAMTFKRFFYYAPFCFTTGAVVASGLGYNGTKVVKNEKGEKEIEHKWDKIVGIYIYELETSANAVEMLRYWNH